MVSLANRAPGVPTLRRAARSAARVSGPQESILEMDKERQASACSQPADGLPGARERRSERDRVEERNREIESIMRAFLRQLIGILYPLACEYAEVSRASAQASAHWSPHSEESDSISCHSVRSPGEHPGDGQGAAGKRLLPARERPPRLPGMQERRSEVGQQELHAAMQHSRTPAPSHQRDRLPSLPGPQSSRASEHGITKMVEDTSRDVTVQALHASTGLLKKAPLRHGETLPGRTHAGAETPHLPGLAPLPAKAARQAQGGPEASACKRAGATSQTKLPALETSGRSSPQGWANAMDAEAVSRRVLERMTKALERLATNSSEAAAKEHFPLVSGAGMALGSGKSLEEEELKPSQLSLPPLQKPKREICALPQAIQEHVRSLPESRPGSSPLVLGKARMLQDDGSRTPLALKSQQLSGSSSFGAGAQTVPERELRGTPACKERHEAWPSCLTVPRLPQSPSAVGFASTGQEMHQELVSKLPPAPRDACAQEVKAQCLDAVVQRQDLVLSKSSASQGADLQPPHLQVPPAEMPPEETASSPLQCAMAAKAVSDTAGLTSPPFAEVPPSSAEDIAARCHSEMAPPESPSPSLPEPAGLVESIIAEAGRQLRAESQGPAPHGPAPPAVALEDAGLGLEAHTIDAATPARPDQHQSTERGKSTAPAAQQRPDPHAHGGKRQVSGAGAPASPGKGAGTGTPQPAPAGQRPKQQPLGIICRVGGKPLRIHPDNTSQYLAVLSIKTETLEELNSSCLARTGQSLAQLREACLQRREQSLKESEGEQEQGEGKHFSLTASGSLNVKPKELLARNSFYNLWKPEVTRVELLKDARCKWEVLERLYAHAPRREREVGRGKRVPGALQEEQADWPSEEEHTDEELLQGEELEGKPSLCMTWVRPSLRSLFTDTETCPQKVPCSPNGKARDATGEATGDLQSTPLAPAVPRGAEAAAPALADGFQDAGDSASLAPSAFLSAGTKPEEASPAASIPPDGLIVLPFGMVC
ncbi:uncharacterized protein LOC135329235 [Dromaius novaehollandiae]|uniref:uncharacterized protein LOC135329235 n=1 Tax=Dromaius novaehollandiae TaxID=8790 RepID=UPI00311F0A66